jgi:hypothetical protein
VIIIDSLLLRSGSKIRIPVMAFAVGVYLPFSTSTAVFAGGVVRWVADKWTKKSEAEAERSGGTLLASGLIAGGALAGIINAFMAGVLAPVTDRMTAWSSANNPFFASDGLAMIPFAAMVIWLTLAGCDKVFARKAAS